MSFDRWTRKYLHRLLFGQFLKTSAEWLGVFLLTFGSLVLLVKLLIPALWPNVLWLGLGAIPATIAAWQYAMKDRFTATESVAYLDRKLQAGGLLMSLSETPNEYWQQQLPQLESQWKQSLPRLRPSRFARVVGIPLLFCVACGFVPLREKSLMEELTSDTVAEQNVEELKELMEKLNEEQILEEEEKEQIAEELDRLMEDKNEPLTHEKWETVDALRQKMQMRVEQSSLEVAKAASAAETLSQAGDFDQLTPEQRKALTEQLSSGLQRLMEKGSLGSKQAGGLSPEMRDRLNQMMSNGQLTLPSDPAEREQLLADLQELLDQEAKKLAELRGQCQGGNCQNGQCLANGQVNGNQPAKEASPGDAETRT